MVDGNHYYYDHDNDDHNNYDHDENAKMFYSTHLNSCRIFIGYPARRIPPFYHFLNVNENIFGIESYLNYDQSEL